MDTPTQRYSGGQMTKRVDYNIVVCDRPMIDDAAGTDDGAWSYDRLSGNKRTGSNTALLGDGGMWMDHSKRQAIVQVIKESLTDMIAADANMKRSTCNEHGGVSLDSDSQNRLTDEVLGLVKHDDLCAAAARFNQSVDYNLRVSSGAYQYNWVSRH